MAKRKNLPKTPVNEFLSKRGNGYKLDPQTRLLFLHMNMLDKAVKYVYQDFARTTHKGLPPTCMEKFHERFYSSYEPLVEVIREEFKIYCIDELPYVKYKSII